jgi:pimeloyl-ACP methyl ester carboxylesterase
MAADADAVRAAIDAIDGDVVVVAHSYGGVQATQGADAGSVAHIVYISAFVLDVGESLFAAVGGVQPDWWDVKDGLAMAGTDAHPARGLFYADVPAAEADAAVARLTTQSVRAFHPASDLCRRPRVHAHYALSTAQTLRSFGQREHNVRIWMPSTITQASRSALRRLLAPAAEG